MDWHSLGTLSPGVDWAAYPQESFDYELLRVIHTWGDVRPVGYALLGQIFPYHGLLAVRKLWAIDAEPKILLLPVPQVLKDDLHFVWTPHLKLGRFPHMGLADWQIELQAFY